MFAYFRQIVYFWTQYIDVHMKSLLKSMYSSKSQNQNDSKPRQS